MENNGYDVVKHEGEFLIARKKRLEVNTIDVGDLRINFKAVYCGPTTIIA